MILLHINRYSATAALGEQGWEMISIRRNPRTQEPQLGRGAMFQRMGAEVE